MSASLVTFADWRAKVDQELAGKPFEKALVHETPEGVSVAPLYVEAPKVAAREASSRPFRICMRHEAGASEAELIAELEEGADALWVPWGVEVPASARFVVRDGPVGEEWFDELTTSGSSGTARDAGAAAGGESVEPRLTVLNIDPIASRARGLATFDTLDAELAKLGRLARTMGPGSTAVMVSTLPYHEAGAHGVDELALALSTGARYLEAMIIAGLTADEAAAKVALQVSVGRDTFLELCKLRALRIVWSKVLSAFGVKASARALVHAVCSSRTMTARDPWVNMLRVTTQVFAAVLGGADVVTPNAFDQALGVASLHGRRVARNTGLVLREESSLGKVADPAGGAYAFETLTDSLARKAWLRFREIEKDGGIVEALKSGRLQAQLALAWKQRLEAISKRKEPILGVSEFANLDEVLPAAAPRARGELKTRLPVHRDSEAFEEIRDAASSTRAGSFESLRTNGRREVLLVTLGDLQARARVGFASSFFAAGGLRCHEVAAVERAAMVCVCGPDELYATHGAEVIRSLKTAGCSRVLVAGRPGPLEKQLRDAGADGFIFVGCDAVSILWGLMGSAS